MRHVRCRLDSSNGNLLLSIFDSVSPAVLAQLGRSLFTSRQYLWSSSQGTLPVILAHCLFQDMVLISCVLRASVLSVSWSRRDATSA